MTFAMNHHESPRAHLAHSPQRNIYTNTCFGGWRAPPKASDLAFRIIQLVAFWWEAGRPGCSISSTVSRQDNASNFDNRTPNIYNRENMVWQTFCLLESWTPVNWGGRCLIVPTRGNNPGDPILSNLQCNAPTYVAKAGVKHHQPSSTSTSSSSSSSSSSSRCLCMSGFPPYSALE